MDDEAGHGGYVLSMRTPPSAGVAAGVEYAVDDDRVLHDAEHDDVRKAFQVDLLERPAPFRESGRSLTEYVEVLLDLIMELLTKTIALVLVPEIAFDELVAGSIPDLKPVAHAFFALRAISRTSSQV